MTVPSRGPTRISASYVAPGYCRLTVVAGRSRADVALPDAVPVAELLPQLAELLPAESGSELHLTRVDGSPLSSEASLGDQQVLTGDIVCLVAGDPPPYPLVADDVLTAVAQAVDARGDRWRLQDVPTTTALAGLFAVAVGVVPLLLSAASSGDAVAAGAVAVLLAIGLLLRGRKLAEPVATAATIIAALYAAVCGAEAASVGAGGSPSGAATLSAAAVAAVAVTALVLPRAPRAVAVALLAIAVTLAAAAGGVRFLSGRVVDASGAVALGWLWICGLSDRFALRTERLRAPTGVSPALHGVEVARVHSRANRAVETMTGLVAGAAVAIVTGLTLVALSDSTWAWAFAGTGSLAAGLRARRFSRRPQVIALAVAALAGLAALACRLVLGVGPQPALVAVFVVGGAAVIAGGVLATRVDVGPSIGLAVDRLEMVVLILLLPLLLGVVGVYGTVQGAAQTLH